MLAPSVAWSGNYYTPHFESRMMTIATNTWTVGQGAILLLGDSNTEMVRPIEIDGCQIINAGFGGARISDIAKRADGLAKLTRPSIVHIMVGTNDASADLKDATSEDKEIESAARDEWADMATNLGKIIDTFTAAGTRVVIWGMPPTGPAFGKLDDFAYVSKIIENVAREKKVRLELEWDREMIGADGYAKPGWLIGDDVHLTPNGQQVRVSRIAEIDKEIFSKTGQACLK